MSRAAFKYYQEMGSALSVTPPAGLSGVPISILPEADARNIAVHNLQSILVQRLGDEYRSLLTTAVGFMLTAANHNVAVQSSTGRHDTFRAAISTGLVPRGLKMGHISEVAAEAVAPDDITQEAFEGFRPAVRERLARVLGGGAVCFVTYGRLRSGRQQGVTRCLTVVGVEENQPGVPAVSYFSAGFGDNKGFASNQVEMVRVPEDSGSLPVAV